MIFFLKTHSENPVGILVGLNAVGLGLQEDQKVAGLMDSVGDLNHVIHELVAGLILLGDLLHHILHDSLRLLDGVLGGTEVLLGSILLLGNLFRPAQRRVKQTNKQKTMRLKSFSHQHHRAHEARDPQRGSGGHSGLEKG